MNDKDEYRRRISGVISNANFTLFSILMIYFHNKQRLNKDQNSKSFVEKEISVKKNMII